MEKLTIQQLAPYLPYGLSFVSDTAYPINGTVENIDIEKDDFDNSIISFSLTISELKEGTSERSLGLDKLKPILYPISCLTKTITHNGAIFNPMIELFTIVFGGCYDEDNTLIKHDSNAIKISTSIERLTYYTKEQCFIAESMGEEGETWHPHFNQYQLFQKLAEWHINFLGIPEHLIIDKETIKQ